MAIELKHESYSWLSRGITGPYMSISVNHLFNRLVLLSKAESEVHGKGSLSFALSSAWEPERKLIHNNPHILDLLSDKVMRYGGDEAIQAYIEMLRRITLRMPEHSTMRARPGVLLGVTVHVMHVKGMHLATLGDASEQMAREFAKLIGVKHELVKVGSKLVSAENAYRMSPHQVYNTVCSVLSEFQGRVPLGPYKPTNTLHEVPPANEMRMEVKEYVMLVYVETPDVSLPPSMVLRNAMAAMPRSLPPINVSLKTGKGPAEARIGFNMFSTSTPWGALTSSLYTSTMLRMLNACCSVVKGPDSLRDQERPTGEEIGRVLAPVELSATFLRNETTHATELRLSILNRTSGQSYGGLIVEHVAEPHSMLNKLQSYFSRRISFNPVILEDAPKNTPEGGVFFYNGRTAAWEIPPMAIQLSS